MGPLAQLASHSDAPSALRGSALRALCCVADLLPTKNRRVGVRKTTDVCPYLLRVHVSVLFFWHGVGSSLRKVLRFPTKQHAGFPGICDARPHAALCSETHRGRFPMAVRVFIITCGS